MPLTPGPAEGVAAGLSGTIPLPGVPFATDGPVGPASLTEAGGVISAPPGNDSDAGDVKAFACCAVAGCVVSESMLASIF